jgi:hypothetical protein
MLNADKNNSNIPNVVLNNSSFVLVFSKYKLYEAVFDDEISMVNVHKCGVKVNKTSFDIDEALSRDGTLFCEFVKHKMK